MSPLKSPLTCMFVCQCDEGTRDIPPSIEAHNLCFHVSVSRLKEKNKSTVTKMVQQISQQIQKLNSLTGAQRPKS